MSEDKNAGKLQRENESVASTAKREYKKPTLESSGKLKELRMTSGGTPAPTVPATT